VPISYKIDGGLCVTTVAGEADLADVRAYLSARENDPARGGVIGTLIDVRGVTTLLSADDLRAIAKQRKQETDTSPGTRTAMLAGSDVVFGILRMYEAFTDGSNAAIRVFRDEGEARAWLLAT
jgi:hypothetical protein